jgi:integrase
MAQLNILKSLGPSFGTSSWYILPIWGLQMTASAKTKPHFCPGTKSPSRLVLRRGTWHFRTIIPQDCRQSLGGLKEFKVSLKTGLLREARLEAGRLAFNAAMIYLLVKKESAVMQTLDKKTIRALARKWLVDGLDQYEQDFLAQTLPLTPKNQIDQQEALGNLAKVYQQKLADGEFSVVGYDWLAYILKANNLPIPEQDSVEIKRLAAEFMKATIELSKIQANRAKGDYSDFSLMDEQEPGTIVPAPPPDSAIPVKTSPLLADVLSLYIDEKKRASAWTERSIADFEPKLKFFAEVVGNLPIDQLNRDMMRSFKSILDKLPARYNQVKEYRDLTLKQLMSRNIPMDKRMSPASLSKYYGTINSFLIWLKNNFDGISDGLTGVLSIKVNHQVDNLRDIFTDEDLKAIFNPILFNKNKLNNSFKYWVPLLGLYTGMRLEEVCQLHVADIITLDNIACININDEYGDKKLKTPAAKRIIPIHSILVERLSFLDHVDCQKKNEQVRLFPELKKQSGRYSHYVSRWFGDYLIKVGVKTQESRKVFHSFRHTFANACKKAGVEEYKAREFLGHDVSNKSITYGRYGKKYSVKVLLEEVLMEVELFDVGRII